MKAVLVLEGAGPLQDLPVDEHGQAFLPREGEYIRAGHKTYKITSVLWHFDDMAVYVAATEEPE